MTLIDRLRKMPEKRREATEGPWKQWPGDRLEVHADSDVGVFYNIGDSDYCAFCGNVSEADWAALVELAEAAHERQQADAAFDSFLEDEHATRDDEKAAYARVDQATERLEAALARAGME